MLFAASYTLGLVDPVLIKLPLILNVILLIYGFIT